MISEDTLILLGGILLLFSLPICIAVFLFNLEVMPNLIRYGWTIDVMGQIVHIIIFATGMGFLIEFGISALIDMIFYN